MTHTTFSCLGILDHFSEEVYNSLLDVESVDSHLGKTRFFEQDFEPLRDIFRRHQVQSFAGICLLHNHSLVDIDEVMVQVRVARADGDERLVTSPVRTSEKLFAESRPWSFMTRSGRTVPYLQPIEYASDPFVLSDYSELCGRQDFLQEFCEYVESRSLGRFIGLALIRRAFRAGTDGEILLEDVEQIRRCNILHFVDKRVADGQRVIQTVHVMALPEELDAIAATCGSGCIPQTICVDRSPGHARETSHRSIHTIET